MRLSTNEQKMQQEPRLHEINGTKHLQILICRHEKARFPSLILFRSKFTVKRVEITVGNCSRSLMFRINLWKGVIVRPHKMEATFWKPQADVFFLKMVPQYKKSLILILGRFFIRKSLIYLKCKVTGDLVDKFFKCINLGKIVLIYDYQPHSGSLISLILDLCPYHKKVNSLFLKTSGLYTVLFERKVSTLPCIKWVLTVYVMFILFSQRKTINCQFLMSLFFQTL